MIIFRPQRGGLVESMNERIEFNSADEMFDELLKSSDYLIELKATKDELSIEFMHEVDDERLGWRKSKYVIHTRKDNSHVIGICSEDYDAIPDGSYTIDTVDRIIYNNKTLVHYEKYIDIDKIDAFNIPTILIDFENILLVSIVNCRDSGDILICRYPCISYESIMKYHLDDIKINPVPKE